MLKEIHFNPSRRDFAARGLSGSIFILFVLIAFIFLADTVVKQSIVLLIIGLYLFVLDYFIYQIRFTEDKVYLVTHLLRKKEVKALRVFVRKAENSDVVFLEYKNKSGKNKIVWINSPFWLETDKKDYVQLYEMRKGDIEFSEKFLKLFINNS